MSVNITFTQSLLQLIRKVVLINGEIQKFDIAEFQALITKYVSEKSIEYAYSYKTIKTIQNDKSG